MELLAYPVIALLFVGIFTREVIAPASKNRCDRRWLLMSTALAASSVAVTLGVGLLYSDAMADLSYVHFSARPSDLAVGLMSFLLSSFIFYWWHRATHRFDLLWRLFHQLHHSATRIEALTAFFAHPLDTAAVLISGFSSYIVLGASPMAAAWALLLTGMFDLFVHADIRTPRWLGYIVQRPEMHTVHHQHEHHADNYGLPVWDLLFGTWNNPLLRSQRMGFDAERSERVFDMLVGRDVHK